jgi:hypothetical protein
MRRWLLAVGLMAAAAAPALAADIDGIPPPPYGSPYGANPYGHPQGAPYGGPYAEPRYAPRPPAHDDDDDDDRYDGRPPVQRYSNVPPRYAPPPTGKACVRSEHVRDRLTAEGWQDFHDGKPASEGLVTLKARRPNGRLFELTLHRCSGALMEARPLQLRQFGPYAYRQPYGPYGAWRWGQQRAPYAQGDDDDAWEERSYADRGQRRWWRD